MKDQETQYRFVELRAKGWSFARIAAELNVDKNTLVVWSRKLHFQIQNLKTIEAEAFQEKCFAAAEARWETLAARLRGVQAELEKRDLSELSTQRLFTLEAALRAEIKRETSLSQFSTPVTEIPPGELQDKALDWTP
ncbi:MAG: hypothetical protein WCO56_03585 [Verrucomicrobiota bacterium]